MLKVPPNLSELSAQDKDDLIVRLFAVVEDLRSNTSIRSTSFAWQLQRSARGSC